MNDVFFDIEDDALPPPLLIMSFNSFLEYFSKTPEIFDRVKEAILSAYLNLNSSLENRT